MLFTLAIIIILLLSIYVGIKRGIIYQLIMTIGFVLSYWIAINQYKVISYYVELIVPYGMPTSADENPFVLYSRDLIFNMRHAFYHGLSFFIVLALGWFITRLVGRLLQFISDLQVDSYVNLIGGAIISFFVHYVALFFILFVLSALPLNFIQRQFRSSSLSRAIVQYTPLLSEDAYQNWVTKTDQKLTDQK